MLSGLETKPTGAGAQGEVDPSDRSNPCSSSWTEPVKDRPNSSVEDWVACCTITIFFGYEHLLLLCIFIRSLRDRQGCRTGISRVYRPSNAALNGVKRRVIWAGPFWSLLLLWSCIAGNPWSACLLAFLMLDCFLPTGTYSDAFRRLELWSIWRR